MDVGVLGIGAMVNRIAGLLRAEGEWTRFMSMIPCRKMRQKRGSMPAYALLRMSCWRESGCGQHLCSHRIPLRDGEKGDSGGHKLPRLSKNPSLSLTAEEASASPDHRGLGLVVGVGHIRKFNP